ncbi:MAG: transposase [Nitrospirota bacterium]
MNKNSEPPMHNVKAQNMRHRHSIRLRGYDYTQAGAYFVTICTQDRKCLLGDIMNEEMQLNDAGRIMANTWAWLATQYAYVELDAWIVMPNHLHGIIVILNDDGRGGSRTAPTTQPVTRKPLGQLIGAFKTVSTKRINELSGSSGIPIWQRNYYEHIIRDEKSLQQIREYIINNPLQWELDQENPNVGAGIVGAVREPPLQNTDGESWRR